MLDKVEIIIKMVLTKQISVLLDTNLSYHNPPQELLNEKEEGLHMLQIAMDSLQIVLPNTSVGGRDSMRRDMTLLQQEYDTLSAALGEAKTQLDGTLAQWTVYDDSVEQLQRWLQDLETQVAADSALQNTLQEKKLQLERVKVGLKWHIEC